MITIDLESSAAPSVVLAAMRAHAGEWRESQIPRELRADGICAIEGWIEGTTFVLTYTPSANWGKQWAPYLRARAAVSPTSGGSRTRVVLDYDMRDIVMPMIGGGFLTFLAVLAIGPRGLWALLWPASVWTFAYVTHRIASRNLTRAGSPPADYLARRIEAAVAGAEHVSSHAPAS